MIDQKVFVCSKFPFEVEFGHELGWKFSFSFTTTSIHHSSRRDRALRFRAAAAPSLAFTVALSGAGAVAGEDATGADFAVAAVDFVAPESERNCLRSDAMNLTTSIASWPRSDRQLLQRDRMNTPSLVTCTTKSSVSRQ